MGRKRKHSEAEAAAPVKDDSAPERPKRTLWVGKIRKKMWRKLRKRLRLCLRLDSGIKRRFSLLVPVGLVSGKASSDLIWFTRLMV